MIDFPKGHPSGEGTAGNGAFQNKEKKRFAFLGFLKKLILYVEFFYPPFFLAALILGGLDWKEARPSIGDLRLLTSQSK